ncbi:hypothetical protein HME7025_01183 [Aquirufa nivalisilvae]|uniref:Uncharacterized protein n=1 Tax=Aquirufa nivalisilvae TaxID=2516557 RepID=A0A2S2DUL2_9BACT|nr:hypothetical protein [Aquirufa nivalisilvae]AWL09046.1 hypothetical protein HME7025_01183 [Aquirufa nivalisilvae]
MKNIDEWVEWLSLNPELAEKYYPEIMQGLTEHIKNSEPYFAALIIQKLPDHFPKWKAEAENHFGIKRKKTIQGYIDLLKAVLIEYEYPSEIEQKAVESVRDELAEQLKYWDKLIDTRFWLTTIFEEKEQTKHTFKSIKREIENNGCFILKTESDTVKIYTPELAVIFTTKELPARNMDTKTETTINGWDYLNTFIEAYKEGEQYFETEFKVSPNTLYGANAEQYVRDIHINYFHVQHTGINEGWGYVKKQFPFIITHKAVKEFGYYSGIVNKVEEQIKKYPRLFATFDKCEHNLQSQQTATKSEQETPKIFEELFYNPEHANPCLKILCELEPPTIDGNNNYIGKAKGVFPLWVKVLKSHKPEPLIKHFKDIVYKDLLNEKVKGLNLTKDASEFRKQYKRLENDNIELDIKTILSQFSQSGKLGK